MTTLPSQLSFQLTKLQYADNLSDVPFLALCTEDTIVAICERLRLTTTSPKDYIMLKGAASEELIFLLRGAAHSTGQNEEDIHEFEAGAHFGVLGFLGLARTRLVSVIATSFCDTACLEPNWIEDIVDARETLRRNMEVYRCVIIPFGTVSHQQHAELPGTGLQGNAAGLQQERHGQIDGPGQTL